MIHRLKHLSSYSKGIYIGIMAFMGVGLAVQLQPLFHKQEPAKAKKTEATPTRFIVPSTTRTPTPTITPMPATIAPTQPSLFSLTIVAIDYSTARPNGLILDAKIRLYKSTGELIAEQTPTAYIQDGPVGKGGDVTFNVPLGTYRAEAESGNKKGNITIELKSFSDTHYYSIYVGAKSIRISGLYYLDSNGNHDYDQGEKPIPGKKVYAVVDTEGRLYTAAETTTDENGYYNLYSTISGKYHLQGEAGPGYTPLDGIWIPLNGGESINYNVGAKVQ